MIALAETLKRHYGHPAIDPIDQTRPANTNTNTGSLIIEQGALRAEYQSAVAVAESQEDARQDNICCQLNG